MKRRTFCTGAAALLGSFLLAPPAAAASADSTTGHAVKDGSHLLSFRSELSVMDISHEFYYSDRFFAHSALEYDHKLALASLGLALSAFNTAESDSRYWVNADVGRQDNLAAAYEELGFADTQYHHYDIDVGAPEDIVGYSLARKTLLDADNTRTTIVALTLRGGGYGGEWASNLHVGEGGEHAGFVAPVEEVFRSFCTYLSDALRREELGTVKVWITGYSRGAIVANLVAGRIHNDLPQLDSKNVYVYLFGVPMALTADDRPDLQQDFDHNHLPNGVLKSTWDTSNIFNILSSGDIVTRVLPEDWGYHRNGSDRFLPSTRNKDELADLNAMGKEFGPTPLVFSDLAVAEDTTAVIDSVRNYCISKENFHDKYEEALMDMIECAFLRSEEEVTEGKVLNDDEIVERLQGLRNFHQFSWWQVIQSVWAASTISRPILERFGSNVPIRVQQIIIPMIAVGLCYGIELDVIKMVANYVVSLLAVRTDPDNLLRAAYCHHGENYIALMEYYTPDEHGMEPFTRR